MLEPSTARIERARASGLKTQERYESLVSEMAELRLDKVLDYGEHRFNKTLSLKESKAVLWANLQRKFQRATNDLIHMPAEFKLDASDRDTYLDLANYALMVLEIGDEEGWITPPTTDL